MCKYKYQLHMHTTPCSACGRLTPKELCETLVKYGYQGAVVTNHFYHGNSGIDRSESTTWEAFVSAYERDYLDIVNEAKKYDLDILFSIEESVSPGTEILCYGVTPEILYANPQLRKSTGDEWIEVMRKNGALVIQAHPFREASYIPNPGPLPIDKIDGLEVYNGGNSSPVMNEKAIALAKENPYLIRTSSADAHVAECLPFGGIITGKRIKTEAELVEALRSGEYEIIPIPGDVPQSYKE